jgi:hypothetical protein
MAVIGQFGKLADTVTPLKGDPFNEFWHEDVLPPSNPVTVFTFTVDGTKRLLVNGLYLTGAINCTVEMFRDSLLIWRGGTPVNGADLNAAFPDGAEFEFLAGQELSLKVQHLGRSNVAFAGNVFGFRRV